MNKTLKAVLKYLVSISALLGLFFFYPQTSVIAEEANEINNINDASETEPVKEFEPDEQEENVISREIESSTEDVYFAEEDNTNPEILQIGDETPLNQFYTDNNLIVDNYGSDFEDVSDELSKGAVMNEEIQPKDGFSGESTLLATTNTNFINVESEEESFEETVSDTSLQRSLLDNSDSAELEIEPVILEPDENEISDEVVYIEGATYIRGINSFYGDFPIYYVYTDDYFADRTELAEDGTVLENAYIYDESLSSISATMSTAAWISRYAKSADTHEEYVENMSRNAQALLRQIGFENIEINEEFQSDITMESIMLIAGQKKVVYDGKEYTLIVIFPDSGTTDAQFPVNVEIGSDEYHSGFKYGAEDVVLPFLNEYIKNNEISGDIKIWGGGMSRAAGIINSTGGLLDLAIDDNDLGRYLPETVNLEKKNVYIYTFGCPATVRKDITWNIENGDYSTRKTDYNNIHNTRNEFDFVIHIFDDDWDMDVFGEENIISYKGKGMLTEEEFQVKVQEMAQQWVLMSGIDPNDLDPNRDFLSYDPETGLYHYVSEEYRTPITGDDLEEFTARFSAGLAPILTRAIYNSYFEPAADLFFGTTYHQMTEIKDAVTAEGNAFIEEAQQRIKELLMQGLQTGDFRELIHYLAYDANPLNAVPQVLINAFKVTNTPYNYDFEKHEFTDELLDDEKMRKVIQEDMLKAGIGVLAVASRIGISDLMFLLDAYQAYQVGFDVLSSGHTMSLYQAWARALDDATDQFSDVYQRSMTSEDAWGYRMVNLPMEGDYTVYVYDTSSDSKGYVLRFNLRDGEWEYGGRTADKDWTVHIGTGDHGAGRVLYLRPDHSYDVVFVTNGEQSSIDYSIDEWSSHFYRDIFKPVNHIVRDTENGTSFENIVLSSSDNQRQDALIVHIGALKSYPTEPNQLNNNSRRLLAASVSEPAQALAEYTIQKIIQMLALNGIDESVIDWSAFRLSGNDVVEYTVAADNRTGYQFLGWYIGDTRISSDLVYSSWLSFSDFGNTIIAKYLLIPEPDPKPSPARDYGSKSGISSSVIAEYSGENTTIYPEVSNSDSRINRVPNTADTGILYWLILFVSSVLIIAAGCWFLRKADRC